MIDVFKREVLTKITAAIGISSLEAGRPVAQEVNEYNVGMTSPAAEQAASDVANEVSRVLNWEGDEKTITLLPGGHRRPRQPARCALHGDQRLLLRARADGNEQRIDRLVEICPRYDYTATDHAFTGRVWLVRRVAHQAVYGFYTIYLQYGHTEQQHYTWILDYERDEKPSNEEFNRASERTNELRILFAELYTSYYAHQWFATEVLNFDLRTWQVLHPEGPAVFEVVANVIDNQREIESVELYLNTRLGKKEKKVDDRTAEPDQTVPDDDHRVTFEDVAEIRYEVLASV